MKPSVRFPSALIDTGFHSHIRLPNHQKAASSHTAHGRTGFPGVWDALDGPHLTISTPGSGHNNYTNRKGWRSYNMETFVDSNGGEYRCWQLMAISVCFILRVCGPLCLKKKSLFYYCRLQYLYVCARARVYLRENILSVLSLFSSCKFLIPWIIFVAPFCTVSYNQPSVSYVGDRTCIQYCIQVTCNWYYNLYTFNNILSCN